jgi:hypothetical protein
MDGNAVKTWVDIVSGIITLVAGLVVALWAYTRFVLERGLLPPVQFDIDCTVAGRQRGHIILEIAPHLHNVGAATLVARQMRVDVRYLDAADAADAVPDPTRSTFGRLHFPRSLRGDLQARAPGPAPGRPEERRGFVLLGRQTFVQPGVDQRYTFVTSVPATTAYVLLWSAFDYGLQPSRLQRAIVWVSRRLGLLQFSLDDVRAPHTAERIFNVAEPAAAAPEGAAVPGGAGSPTMPRR